MPEQTHRAQLSADPEAQRRPPGIGPACLVSALLGAATAMAVAGLVFRFHVLFGDRGPLAIDVTGTVVGIAMMTLALGVRLPQRFAVWVCAVAWRRFVSLVRANSVSASVGQGSQY